MRSQVDKGRISYAGQGPVQPKPGQDFKGKSTVELGPDLSDAREQAAEALRQQKIPGAQRDLVSDFYKNLTPPKNKSE